jgi:hypothetical protein
MFAPTSGQPETHEAPEGDGLTFDHVKDFLDCMGTRRRPNGDVLHGNRSAQSSHLGNLAYLEQRRIEFDPQREQIIWD